MEIGDKVMWYLDLTSEGKSINLGLYLGESNLPGKSLVMIVKNEVYRPDGVRVMTPKLKGEVDSNKLIKGWNE
jgi:hypothetical protein